MSRSANFHVAVARHLHNAAFAPSWLRRLRRRPSKRGFVRVAVVFCAAVLCGAIFFFAYATTLHTTIARGDPRLQINPRDLDMGEVAPLPNLVHRIPVTNTASESVHISQIKASCNCTSVEPVSAIIPPGGTQDVTVTIDVRRAYKSLQAPVPNPVPFSITLVAATDAKSGTSTQWVIHGLVRSSFDTALWEFNLGEVCADCGFIEPRVFEIVAREPLKGITLECEGVKADAERIDDAGLKYRITIVPPMGVEYGPFRMTLKATPFAEAQTNLTRAYFDVTGTSVPDAILTPAPVYFGAVRLGGKYDQSAVVSSRSGRSYMIDHFDIPQTAESTLICWATDGQSDPPATDSRGTAHDGTSMMVEFCPKSDGVYKERIYVVLKDTAGKLSRVPLDVSAYVSQLQAAPTLQRLP